MSELNPNAKLWVDALRSGKYEQGKNVLTQITPTGDLDCCLGVACKLAIEHGVNVEESEWEGPKQTLRIYSGAHKSLPQSVIGWLGLTSSDGRYSTINKLTTCKVVTYLTDDNDHGKDFSQIADIIESKPEGLFEEGR